MNTTKPVMSHDVALLTAIHSLGAMPMPLEHAARHACISLEDAEDAAHRLGMSGLVRVYRDQAPANGQTQRLPPITVKPVDLSLAVAS